MIILIPAYEPDQQLPALIRSIRDAEPWATVVVVDDGSGPEYKDVFDGVNALGCHVIGYARNRGKGFALKTGFGFIADHLPGRNVVCADSDGQHTIVDILRVAAAVQPGLPAMVLGTRNFTGKVPARSRFGNTRHPAAVHGWPPASAFPTPRPASAATRRPCSRGCAPSAASATSTN